MALKQATRSATVAFSPTAPFIAAGTMAGAIDMSFSTTACMEIFKLDFSTPDLDLPLIGTAPASERLHRLSWGTTGIDTQLLPYGIIAGGQSDGSVALWNPAKLIRGGDSAGEEVGDALIGKLDKHKGSVKGLEFNTFNPNWLATGGEDGELNIWDLTKPGQPSLFPSLKSGTSGTPGEISYLAWNRKVPNILASTSYNGTSVVWDLKKQKSVISFADPTSRRRCSALQWNPEVATQLIVASDDDRSPGLQVWDLRNSVSPLKELNAHSRGVLAMAWCPSDSGLLLTCGKDNRTLCWDINTGEVLYELPASTNWNFDVQWSARIPGLLSTSSFDGKVQIYNIESCGATSALEEAGFGQQEGTAQPTFKRAPKWLRRPSGVSFGFGGKLVTFGPKKSANDSEITIRSINTDGDLAKRSEEFETSVKGAEKEGMKQYCEKKAASAQNEEEKETWSFLGVLFGDDPRRQLLKHLNFEPAPPPSAAAPAAEEPSPATAAVTNGVQDLTVDGPRTSSDSATAPPGEENGEKTDAVREPEEEDFFEKLPSTPPADPKRVETVHAPEVPDHHVEDKHVAEDDPSEDAVQRALVVGNYQAAVEVCLKAGRLADALLLASVAGNDLWQTTQTEYLKRVRRPYTKIIAAVVSNDWRSLVAERPLALWKETLALICTYSAQGDECTALCGQLAAKLAGRRDREFQQAATLCYMIAGDIEKAASQWSKDLRKAAGTTEAGPPVDAIQDVMEKVVVLGLATGRKKVSSSLAPLVGTYAELLVNQGRLATAMEYLALIPPEESDVRLKVLRDRIYRSGQIALDSVEAPEFPFEGESVSAPEAAATPQASPVNQGYYSQPAQPQQPSQAYGGAAYGAQTAPLNPYAPTTNLYAPAPAAAPTPPSWQPYPPSNVQSAPPLATPGFTPVTQVEQRVQPGFQQQQNAPFVLKFNPAPTNFPPPFVPQQPEAPLSQPPRQATGFQPKAFEAPIPPISATAAGGYGQQFTQPGVPQPSQQFGAPKPPQQFMQPAPPSAGPPSAWGAGSAGSFAPPPPAVGPPPTLPPINTSTQSAPPPQFIPAAPAHPPAQFAQPVSPVMASQPAPVAPPPAPAGPPPTVHTADVSKVKPELKPVVAAITKLFDEVAGAMPPNRKKETEDSSKKLGALFVKLNSGDVSASLTEKLQRVTQAITAGDYAGAKHVQVEMTTTNWDEGSHWMPTLKRLITARGAMR